MGGVPGWRRTHPFRSDGQDEAPKTLVGNGLTEDPDVVGDGMAARIFDGLVAVQGDFAGDGFDDAEEGGLEFGVGVGRCRCRRRGSGRGSGRSRRGRRPL